MVRVLVTRPEPGATATATALRAAGHEPVLLSLTRIVPLAPEPCGVEQADAVAITSANAVRHVQPALAAALAGLPAYAVGGASARAARAAGFTRVVPGRGDATALTDLVSDALPAGATLIYLCGRVRRPDFEQALRARGLRVICLETYDTVPTEVDEAMLASIGGDPFAALTVHSAEGARALAALSARPAFQALSKHALLVAISARAASPAAAIFGARVRIAREPTDAAMIDAVSGTV